MSLTQQVPPACLGSDQVVFSAQTVVFVCSPQPVARGIHEGGSGLCPRFCLGARHGGVWDVWDVWESIPTVWKQKNGTWQHWGCAEVECLQGVLEML